jgi:mono/diheme cytochrome c family protein
MRSPSTPVSGHDTAMKTKFVLALAATILAASPAAAETPVERGFYLVNAVAACASCHSSRTQPGAPLSGGSKFGSEESSVYAPNITPDQETGIGRWSDEQTIDAIRTGVRPDGSRIRPPMPQTAYRGMSDTDVMAIVAYLRSIRPIYNAVPRTTPAEPIRAAIGSDISLLSPSKSIDTIAAGRYIANSLSHCTECHTPAAAAGPDLAHHLNEGGRIFRGPYGVVTAPNITADKLNAYSDSQLATIITKGVRPDGSILKGPMPVGAYAGVKQVDLNSIIAYLRQPSQDKSK